MIQSLRPRALALLVILAGAAPVHAQTFRTDDARLRRIWEEGMERSQTETLAQALLDSIGPRLAGSPGFRSAVEWLEHVYAGWGIEVRREEYGTWTGWRQGAVHVDLTAPRVQTLEAKLLAWSPGTTGAIEGDVIAIPSFDAESDVARWLRGVRGKVVLASAPLVTCREPQALRELAREETVRRLETLQANAEQSWSARLRALGGGRVAHRRLEEAGAIAVVTSRWSQGWGVNKIFDADTRSAVSIDVSCEDYGLLVRLAEHRQAPRLRIEAEAEALGEVPMFNVIAELRGTELPDEYVILSAHLDSWHGAQGATDNGTGTIMMLEAMRILHAAYPHPRRTILVGHWGGEEQGLIGSRAFTEDHPEIVENLQVLFNQDNGTWRVEYVQTQGFLRAGESIARWMAQVPTEISGEIELDFPGPQEFGGSDHMAFLCRGVPGFRLQSHYPDYRQYTWHTNRDTYDKIIFDDLTSNATLAAMLAYLASEDPARVSRERSVLPRDARTGRPREWAGCPPARRQADR